MGLSSLEIALVLLVALLLFGPGRIAGVGRGLGQGIQNFRRGLREGDDEDGKAHAGGTVEVAPTTPPRLPEESAVPAVPPAKKAAKST